MTFTDWRGELRLAVQKYSHALLQQNYPQESKMIDAVGLRDDEDRVLTYVKDPRAKIVSTGVMGGGDTYCFEMNLGEMVIGFTLITNYDSIRHKTGNDDLTNVFLTLVPVYVVEDCVVEFWAWSDIPDLKISKLTKRFKDMTAYLNRPTEEDPA